jgi:hypothetical protein
MLSLLAAVLRLLLLNGRFSKMTEQHRPGVCFSNAPSVLSPVRRAESAMVQSSRTFITTPYDCRLRRRSHMAFSGDLAGEERLAFVPTGHSGILEQYVFFWISRLRRVPVKMTVLLLVRVHYMCFATVVVYYSGLQ